MAQSTHRIIVTGGAKGIGKAITERLLADGFAVEIVGRTKADLEACHQELGRPEQLSFSVLDLADRVQVQRYCSEWQGPLYGIVNNAGICKTELLNEQTDIWDDVINVNVNGLYFLTKGLMSHVVDNGRIVNISSQLGKEGRAGYSAYCASKFAVIGLTKVWAKELGARGITVNAVCPGWVATDMSMKDVARLAAEKGVDADDYYNEICKPLELQRFTTPEEVANLVAFLVSEGASGMTGRDMLMHTIWNQE